MAGVREAARDMRGTAPAAAFAFDDRHPVQRDFASWRSDPAHCAHHRINAGRKTFAGEGPRVSAALKPADNARHMQLAKDMSEDHGGDNIAASRIEKDDAAKVRVRTARLEEVDKSLRRVGLDDPIRDDHMRTARPAPARLERLDAKRHGAGLRADRRRERSQTCEYQAERGEPLKAAAPAGGR